MWHNSATIDGALLTSIVPRSSFEFWNCYCYRPHSVMPQQSVYTSQREGVSTHTIPYLDSVFEFVRGRQGERGLQALQPRVHRQIYLACMQLADRGKPSHDVDPFNENPMSITRSITKTLLITKTRTHTHRPWRTWSHRPLSSSSHRRDKQRIAARSINPSAHHLGSEIIVE